LILFFFAHFIHRTGSHKVVERYFSPPSGAIDTIIPLSNCFAFFSVILNIAPELGPTNIPSRSASSLEVSSAFLRLTSFISST